MAALIRPQQGKARGSRFMRSVDAFIPSHSSTERHDAVDFRKIVWRQHNVLGAEIERAANRRRSITGASCLEASYAGIFSAAPDRACASAGKG